MKTCSLCREDKELVAFPPDKRNKDGRSSLCRACAAAQTKAWRENHPEYKETKRPRDRAHYASNRERIRDAQVESRLMHRYGITQAQYDEMLEEQDGACAICRQPCKTGQRLCVDHDHETGEVRGLLCRPCNGKLGALENVEWRMAAEVYLARTEAKV